MSGMPADIFDSDTIFQAVAAAVAKVTLISPFVGRILDWYKVAAPPQLRSPP
jgi:transaldolase